MKRLDTSDNRRIPLLMELVSSMPGFTDPQELLSAFIATLRRAYGSRAFVQLSTRGLEVGEYRVNQPRIRYDPKPFDIEELLDNAQRPVQRGGILGQIVAAGRPVVLHEVDLRNDPALGEHFAGYGSLVATPLFQNELGFDWVVLLDPSPTGLSDKDLEDIILRANLVAAMVSDMLTTRKLAAANDRIQREIDAIARIQRALLPEQLPQIPGLALSAHYRTVERAGGDLYDIARVGQRMQNWIGGEDPRWAILIGDVSGHGPAAAVVMAMFHSILHTYPRRPAGPAEVFAHVNRHLCAKRIDQSFITALLAFYDAQTRTLTYCRAGHHPPLLKRFPHVGPPSYLNAVGDLPLGIFPEVEYHQASLQLEPGQTLVLYTDGITDAKRLDGGAFGTEGIEQSLVHCTGEPECVLRHITAGLAAHQADLRPEDDQIIVAIQVL